MYICWQLFNWIVSFIWKLDFFKVRFCGTPVGRKTDFPHLQRAIFYRPDFRSAVCLGVWQQYSPIRNRHIIWRHFPENLISCSSAYPRYKTQISHTATPPHHRIKITSTLQISTAPIEDFQWVWTGISVRIRRIFLWPAVWCHRRLGNSSYVKPK